MRRWIIRASQPGPWLWLTKIVHWCYERYGSRSTLMVEREEKRDYLKEGAERYQAFKARLYEKGAGEE